MSAPSVVFTKAVKEQSKLRLALHGPSNSGKTWTALVTARALAGKDGKVALIDTERGSAAKYADRFDFDALVLDSHHPERYMEAVVAAADAGYDVLVIDSMSHEYQGGVDSLLELVDRFTEQSSNSNAFTSGWSKATPLHTRFVDVILRADLHIIGTLRVKTAYVMEKDNRNRDVPKKVGLAPIQREGVEYEFDVTGAMDMEHTLTIDKSRYPDQIPSGSEWPLPGDEWTTAVLQAVASGETPKPREEATEDDVEKLKAMLLDEGIGGAEFEKGLSTIRARNGGILPPEVVARKIADAEQRAEARADAAASS